MEENREPSRGLRERGERAYAPYFISASPFFSSSVKEAIEGNFFVEEDIVPAALMALLRVAPQNNVII